jgi:hypothetical protein
MKPEFHARALKAHRLHRKGIGFPQIGGKLRLADANAAAALVRLGDKIAEAENFRLTSSEHLLLKTLARIETRNMELDTIAPKTSQIDRAAGKPSGWCSKIADVRLRMIRDYEIEPGRLRDRLNLVYHSKLNGSIWLTGAGWTLCWEAGFVLQNWKVPA